MPASIPVGKTAAYAPPQGKGLMGYWAKLASRAAFRSGKAVYCGYQNDVLPGMWAGGIVGLKSILGVHSRSQSLSVLEKLAELGYIRYTLDTKTKKLTYQIHDWVLKCSGTACIDGCVYATEGYGFLCLPRNITQRLVDAEHTFQESDAWLDLWCHTVWKDRGNAFSMLGPVIQFERRHSVLTLETLGQRWKWKKQRSGDSCGSIKIPCRYTVFLVLMAISFTTDSILLEPIPPCPF